VPTGRTAPDAYSFRIYALGQSVSLQPSDGAFTVFYRRRESGFAAQSIVDAYAEEAVLSQVLHPAGELITAALDAAVDVDNGGHRRHYGLLGAVDIQKKGAVAYPPVFYVFDYIYRSKGRRYFKRFIAI